MDQPSNRHWFLRKFEDGSVFGPLSFAQLSRWASTAQIAPHDSVSTDQLSWLKAPMMPQLGMDWLVEVTSERYYGPTTLGAIQEFIRLGEIDAETFLINACDGTRRKIQEMPALLESAANMPEPEAAQISEAPTASGMSINVQDRIRDLEQALREERRALHDAEERYRDLERKYNELAQKP
jgi:hypothetical protein